MSVEQIATFYVEWVEPALKGFAILLIIMSVIYVLSFIKNPKKQLDIATQFVEFFYGLIVKTIMGVFHGFIWFCLFVWRSFHIIFSTIRDFFMSRI